MTKIKLYLSVSPKLSPVIGKKMSTKYFDVESRYGNDAFADFSMHRCGSESDQCQLCQGQAGWPANPGHHPILLTPTLAVNHYGDIEILIIRQIIVVHGK